MTPCHIMILTQVHVCWAAQLVSAHEGTHLRWVQCITGGPSLLGRTSVVEQGTVGCRRVQRGTASGL